MIFTKLFTPRKFDKYLQLRHLRLWSLERDYGDLDKFLNCPSIGTYVTSREGRSEGEGGGKICDCSIYTVCEKRQTLNKPPIHAIVNYD